jgi:hypothetical protein
MGHDALRPDQGYPLKQDLSLQGRRLNAAHDTLRDIQLRYLPAHYRTGGDQQQRLIYPHDCQTAEYGHDNTAADDCGNSAKNQYSQLSADIHILIPGLFDYPVEINMGR